MGNTVYPLPTIIDYSYLETLEYNKFKRLIAKNGFLRVKTDELNVCIYNPVLALIFTSKEFPATTGFPSVQTVINGGDFLNSYIEGYKVGIQYFNENYKPSLSVLYGEKSEHFISDIRNLYIKHLKRDGGDIKTDIPLRMSNQVAYQFGECSGIVSMIEELANLHPSLFTNESERGKPHSSQSTKFKGFDSKLNAEQIKKLVPWLNLAELFENTIDETILTNLFNGSLESPLKLNNNRLLAYFLNKLSKKKLITKYWQAAAERTKSFISSDDKEIIRNDLSKALSALEKNGNPKNSEHIDNAINLFK